MRPSHLTRAVFRAIIANRPYVIPGCRNQCQKLTRHGLRDAPLAIGPYVQQRGLLTALLAGGNRNFEGARYTTKNLQIALGRLVDLLRAQRTNSRPPSDDELIDAYRFIFKMRLDSRKSLTRNEVHLVSETFLYFQKKGIISDTLETPALTRADLDTILSTLALQSEHEKYRTDTSALARLVFQSLPLESRKAAPERGSKSLIPIYIKILAYTGSVKEAISLFAEYRRGVNRSEVSAWIDILRGLDNEGNSGSLYDEVFRDLCQILRQAQSTDFESLISYLAVTDRIEYAKSIYDIQTEISIPVTTQQLRTLTELCARAQQFKKGQPYFRQLQQRIHEEGVLGSVFIWLAAQRADAVEMSKEIVATVTDMSLGNLSIEPINHLFEFALDTRQKEMAVVAMRLADHFDVRPNGKTYSLQLKHELDYGNLEQARNIYEQLIREDIPNDNSDLPILNKYAAAVAFSSDLNYALLMRIVDSLLERNADFSADALAGLCKVFLQRDELEDAMGLLRHRADFYSETDRARIGAVFQEFILDTLVKDQRAYNAYELFRHAFPEASAQHLLAIMQSFFERDRSDLACLILSHMRERENGQSRPDAAAYAACFLGIAKCRDVDGLQMVYNMLKLDLEVQPTTHIRNAMMLAYIACQQPFTAMIDQFWKIMESKEGPSYSTFEIGLRACEQWVPVGGFEARKIIAIMQAWNLEITKELYDCYVGAIAGQSEFEYAVELIEEMERDIGARPDAVTIGTFYNAIPWQYRKDEVEKWAKQTYPDLWEDLLSYGDEIDEEWEIRYFKIDRTISIDDDQLFELGQYDPRISKQILRAMEPPKDAPKDGM